ncbi:MAG TPA: hypothetical protein VK616_11665, partial [Flavitalea sp.]|nr:hypothetical protein [Flavitalea sp.]
KHKRHLLYLGIAFHLVIILVFGLVTFACSMIGALIIYLMPQESDFFKGRFVGIYKIALKLRQRVTSKYNSTTG